ncbi:MAG TPA: cysteine desulfurase family protein [Bryobacteraceae bacterium]|jgi:cysteine desulfurase|nr:cysteine desulfurase family protein [Bryobacteraceae bacterium]
MSCLYFDHNATTPLAPEVADTYASALREVYGNASSVHTTGQMAKRRLEQSRRTVGAFVNASPGELVFTSGGTESNNLAILGLVRALPAGPKHVIASTIEHPAVLETMRQLERDGVAVSYARTGADGIVRPEDIRRHLRPETVLISVMHANNEVGTIQPIQEIARIAHEHGAYFHSDGVQAFGKIDVDVQALGIDLYSMSAHKVFAPKGVGALFVRKGIPFRGIQSGGHHERERRAGTENVPGIIAFAAAVELSRKRADVASVRDRFEAQAGGEVNGDRSRRLPNTSNLLFRGVSGEAMVIALDMRGMAVSTGSACSSGSIEPSHVLLAMGRTVEEARSSVRFSFGPANTFEDADRLAAAVNQCTGKLRKEAPHVAV